MPIAIGEVEPPVDTVPAPTRPLTRAAPTEPNAPIPTRPAGVPPAPPAASVPTPAPLPSPPLPGGGRTSTASTSRSPLEMAASAPAGPSLFGDDDPVFDTVPGSLDGDAPHRGARGDVFSVADGEEDPGAETSPGIVPGATSTVFEPSTPRAAPVGRGVSVALDDDDENIDRKELATTAVGAARGDRAADAIGADATSVEWAEKKAAKGGKRGLLIGIAAVVFLGFVMLAAAAVFLGPRLLAALSGPVAQPTSMVAVTPEGTPAETPVAIATDEQTANATPEATAIATQETVLPTAAPTATLANAVDPTPRPTRTAVAIAATSPRPRVSPTPKPRQTAQPSVSAGDLEFMTTKADVLVVEGKLAAAKKQYEKIIALDKRYGPAHLGLARTLESMGDVKGACREWRTYLSVAPAGKGASLAGKKAAACK